MYHRCIPDNNRRALTLLELLLAVSLVVIIVGALGALGKGVEMSHEYTQGHATATQHARVALERIVRAVEQSTANEQFPGAIVLADEVGTARFPDTLVVWRPSGNPANPAGLPRYSELVIFCPDPNSPSQLLEITVPDDNRTVPAISDLSAWATNIDQIKQAGSSQRVVLSGLLHTCSLSRFSTGSRRGAARFEVRYRPSRAQLTAYRAGTREWKAVDWVQGIYGSRTGLCQTWVRIELQLLPGSGWVANDSAAAIPVAFFGSAAAYYEAQR